MIMQDFQSCNVYLEDGCAVIYIQRKCITTELCHSTLCLCLCHRTATAEKTLLCPILSHCYGMPGRICQRCDLCRDVSPCVRPM